MPVAASPFLIVGIGASAGGLEAFKSLFSGMPEDSGMAFVLVQHLSPDHNSMLVELLGRATRLHVVEAKDGVTLKPNCVFVIPPNATMTVAGGRLKIVRPAPPRNQRRPIDTFLLSLADDQGERAIGIILAGTGSDGALGVAAIKEHGGFTLAQAAFDHQAMAGMPRSAAATGLVDEVLEVEAMPARLRTYAAHLTVVAPGKDDDGIRVDAVSHLATILRALHARTGHDFGEYKEKTIVRRLQRRMQVLQIETPEAYSERLAAHPEELDLLFREVLISVTHFFRDPAAFEALNAAVIGPLMTAKGSGDEIRIWVPGCATGEEAYTLAMLLREASDTRKPRPKIQIFATDLDQRAIAVARSGRYAKAATGLSTDRAERWFHIEGDELCIAPEIREMCIFSVHSAIKHPPFSRLDLISCRNLLIYLDTAVQERLMRTFHYALRPHGKLFLGSSESVSRTGKLFSVIDKKYRIFDRRDVTGATMPVFATGSRPVGSEPVALQANPGDDIDRSVRRVIEKYGPPHLLLDRANRIVRFSGGAVGQYLEPSPGPASLGLFDILRKALRPAAREILQQVRDTMDIVRREDVAIRIDGKPRVVSLSAERLAEHGPDAEFVVLAVHDGGAVPARGKPADGGGKSAGELQLVEQELRTTRTQLQSTIDELETANEEMKSSNEEYQSVNEELQSSNEELETAKEEMQSVNEELQTINTEIASKNEQLTQLNSDLNNLLESTHIATLFLDDGLRVRRFTRGVSDLFHLRDADIGRPITEIVTLLDYPDLNRDLKAVLRKLTAIERQVTLSDTMSTYILQMRPYRTVDNVIDGVVLTFVDITARQAADTAVRTSEAKFRMLFDYIDEGFYTLEKLNTAPDAPSDYRYLTANPGFEQQSGLKSPVGRTIREVIPEAAEAWFEIFDKVWETGEAVRFEREMAPHGRVLESFAFRFDNGAGLKLGVIFLDVSDRKRHDEQQELLLREMDHRIKNLFAITSGVVSLSARSAESTGEMATTIQGRLGAMASSHQLVRPPRIGMVAEKPTTTLAKIVDTVLKPYVDRNDAMRIEIDGPDVTVGGDAVTSLAMILHELATNAAKYGSLSGSAGHVHVGWRIAGAKLALSWTERGGPAIAGPPAREGFGSLLARRSARGQLDGQLSYDWNRKGVTVILEAATERLTG